MNEQPTAPKILSTPVRQIGSLVGVLVLGVLAKQIISATGRWRILIERFSWVAWTATILGSCVAAVVAASIAAVIGKKLNRPTAVLLAIIAGGLVTGVAYHPMLGAAIGLVVGSLVAAGVGRPVGSAALKALAFLCGGLMTGTVAFSFYDSWQEVPLITTALLTTVFCVVVVILYVPLIRTILSKPDTADQEPRAPFSIRPLIARTALLIVMFCGFWLSLSTETVVRMMRLEDDQDLTPTPIGTHWLWHGVFEVRSVWLGPNATDADVAKLLRFESLQSLTSWHSRHLTDRSLETIAKLARISELRVRGAGITDNGLEHLRRAPSLRYLTISEIAITGAGLARCPPSLVSLGLADTPITDADLEHLPHSTVLLQIDLSRTRITDAGFDHLLRVPSLQFVYLAGTKVSDDGFEKLVVLKGLKFVDLAQTNVTDEALAHLCRLPGLEFLDLTDTRVSDEGLEYMKKTTSLKRIRLEGTRVTDAGVTALRKALPGVIVEAPDAR